jgi:Ca-activated chloride channel family protein
MMIGAVWAHAPAWRRGFVCVVLGAGALSCTARDKATSTAAPVDGEPSAAATTAMPSAKDDPGGSPARGEVGTMASPAASYGAGGHAAASRQTASLGAFATTPSLAPTAADVPHLDPNARYATTYRPGGAALAAFEAAVARASIPAADRDLVGDFAARYAPTLGKPATGAMAFAVDTERSALGPNGGDVNLRIAMRSSDANPGRAPLSVHVVLDVSGSMGGSAIANARSAAESLVARLDANDDFSMVTFSSEAKVLVPDGLVGSRRGWIADRIRGVVADGGTNISAGLDLGYQEAKSSDVRPDAVRIVMFLSDGHANGGDTRPGALADRAGRAFQDGVQTSSFGLGADFDAPLMSAIADRGAGGYYYLADSSQIAPALARELDARLVPVAQAVEVRVRLRSDVVATKVFGSRELGDAEALRVREQEIAVDVQAQANGIKRDRREDSDGGMRFFIPAFARDDRHAMLLTLRVPAGTSDRSIASVEIRYKDRVAKQNVTKEIPVTMHYAANDAASAATVDASVERTTQAFAAGDAILEAVSDVERNDRFAAAQLLGERAAILRAAADQLHEPMFGDDAARFTRLASAVDGTDRVGDPLPLAVLLRGSSAGYLR